MRIYISGTAGQGKSTLINDFMAQWPSYKQSEFNYRKLLKEGQHSAGTNKETQQIILDGMIDEVMSWRRGTKVIMDRGPLDNIVYSLWAHDKGICDIDEIPSIAQLNREKPNTASKNTSYDISGKMSTEKHIVSDYEECFWLDTIRSLFQMMNRKQNCGYCK